MSAFIVQSWPLRIAYILLGGIPSLILALFSAAWTLPFARTAVTAPTSMDARDLSILVWGLLSLTGVASGWLAFFGVGAASMRGRYVHTALLSGGIASVLRAYVVASPSLVLLIPAGVGVAILYHLWRPGRHLQRAVQPAAPADRRGGG